MARVVEPPSKTAQAMADKCDTQHSERWPDSREVSPLYPAPSKAVKFILLR